MKIRDDNGFETNAKLESISSKEKLCLQTWLFAITLPSLTSGNKTTKLNEKKITNINSNWIHER
jgi:hypothetical protein